MFAAVFPSECRLCGAPLANLSRLPVCDLCLQKIIPIPSPCCDICGDSLPAPAQLRPPLAEKVGEPLCAECGRERPLFARAASYGAYAHELRELIHLLKYHQVRSASGALGRMMAQAAHPLLAGFESHSIVAVPVPLHATKFRERGFNQSELIARSALKGLSCLAGDRKLALDTTLLLRRRVTESQVGMTRDQRRKNIRGAFTVAARERISGREVLLLDDVMTTGATVSECTRVLRAAGAKTIVAVTVARSLKSSALFLNYREEVEGAAGATAHPC